MKVLHVVPSYLPARRYGGPVFATHALCKAIAAEGCEVTVATTSVDGPHDSDVPIGVPVYLDGVAVRYFRSPILRRLYYAPAMARMLREECGSFDVVHLHSVYLWPTWIAARCARSHRVPYVISPRGMLVKELIARKSPWVKRAWIFLIERRNLELAAAVHVTSAAEEAELKRFGFKLPRVREVPNGFQAEPESAPPAHLPRSVSQLLSSGRPSVLYLGRISWKKGLDRLIPAMAQVPEATLIVAGNDDESYTPKLEALAAAAGVRERVLFIGPIYGSAKHLLYRSATVFVLPSYSENFGNVVLEAMAEGCPVIVTPEVGAAGIVAQSGAGLVVPGEAVRLAAAVRDLCNDDRRRSEMGAKGKLAVRDRHSWQATASRMVDLYREVTARA